MVTVPLAPPSTYFGSSGSGMMYVLGSVCPAGRVSRLSWAVLILSWITTWKLLSLPS